MDAAGREMQVRTFVEEVWNGRNYEAVDQFYEATHRARRATGSEE
jgi:hypothetical protein